VQINRTGQLIKAKVNSLPFVDHYGITLIQNGKTYILHNTPFRGSVIDPIEVWLQDRQVIGVQNTQLCNKSNQYILNLFKTICKRPYNLLSYNCEHFIDCMLSRQVKSEQIISWLTIGALGVGAYYLL
jgi:hypothetical protein